VSGDNQLVAARAGGRQIRRRLAPHRLVESHPPHVDVSEIGYRPIACRVDIEVLQTTLSAFGYPRIATNAVLDAVFLPTKPNTVVMPATV